MASFGSTYRRVSQESAMAKHPNNRRTTPGLGDIPRVDSAEMKRVRESFRDHVANDPEAAAPESGKPASAPPKSWQPESTTGTRRRRSDRPAVAVDQVGEAAVKLARTRRESAPKLVASRAVISKAPIDTRAAFVLSLVDGRNSVAAIIDMAGMPEAEVKSLLERLARLGLITLP
jgi:hypothetical protein